MTEKVSKFYCSSNDLIGQRMGYFHQIYGRRHPIWQKHPPRIYERVMHCDSFVDQHEDRWHQQNIFIIPKNVAFLMNGYNQVSKGINQINNLLHTGITRNKTRTIYGCLHINLLLFFTKRSITVTEWPMSQSRNISLSTKCVSVIYVLKYVGVSLGSNSLTSSYTEYT